MFVDGQYFTTVEDKEYCESCFEELADSIICCERCYVYEHRNETTDERFVKSFLQINDEVVYYHVKCLLESEKCPICKEYLENKDVTDVFVDYDCVTKYHTSCVEDENNISKFHICRECGYSLRVKCDGCNYRFMDCYNPKCHRYGYYSCYDKDRYDGYCSSCNW